MQKEKTDFSRTVGLRLYDTELIDKLNRWFEVCGIRYDSKNAYLTDLIEAGLNSKECEDGLKEKSAEEYLITDKTIKDLYRRLGNLTINTAVMLRNKYLREQFAKQSSVKRRIARKSFLKSLEISLWLIEQYDKECRDAFDEYLALLEDAKPPEYERDEMYM